MISDRKNDLLVQYKSYMDNLNAIGNQHSQTRAFYVSIISAILVFLSFVSDKDLSVEEIKTPGQITLIFLGIILCGAWFVHILSFGKLYRAKFDILRDMEKELAYPIFEEEYKKLNEYNFFFFTRIERFICLVMAIPFFILVIFLLI
jgi:hypothetical protein